MADYTWIAALALIAVWWLIIASPGRAGTLKKYNATAIGPLLMVRTYRGQRLLDWLAKPRRLWKAITALGMPLVVLSMLVMLVSLIGMDLWMLFGIENIPSPGPANSPQNFLAIPGLNQFIPFWWGWVALIIAMVVHEFAHAIMAKVESIKVTSLGLILVPIPIGAFAEIDEEELFGTKSEGATADILGPMETRAAGEGKRRASPRQFINILSAGVISNFIVALVAFALLFGPVLGAVAASDCLVIYDVVPGSPAELAGIAEGAIVVSVDGTPVNRTLDFDARLRAASNATVAIAGLRNGTQVNYTVPVGATAGLYITAIVDDDRLPARAAGIGPNQRLLAIDGTPIDSQAALTAYMNNTTAGQRVGLRLAYPNGTQWNATVTLGQGTGDRGQIGVYTTDNPLGLSTALAYARGYLDELRSMPYSVQGWLRIMILPVLQFTGDDPGFTIFTGAYASLFAPSGWAKPLGTAVYGLAECLFWIGWLNFNVGLCNCLPMIPFDGGHIFREATRTFMGRFIKDPGRAEYVSRAIVNAFAMTLLASIVFLLVAPYLAEWLLR